MNKQALHARLPLRSYKLIVFIIIGGFCALLYILASILLVEFASLNERLASAVAYFAILPLSFLGHRRHTFRATGKIWPQAMRFIFLHGCNIGISVAAMIGATDLLKLPYIYGSVLASLIVPPLNYFVLDRWVFGRKII